MAARSGRERTWMGLGRRGTCSSWTASPWMIGTYARRLRAADDPWAPTHEEREAFCREILERWGGPVGIETRASSVAADPSFRDWWAAYLRMGASPSAAVALTRMNAQIDVRHVPPTIRVPTLVLHRAGDRTTAGEGPVAAAAARIAALAGPGGVLVSQTVVDLVTGSGLHFSDRGSHALAADEQARALFAVR